MKQDKLIIGGHEFDSRFILGSGKYSLDLINAAVQNAGAHLEQEMQKKQFVLQDLQEK